jgi:hypothetical protein
MIISGTCLWMNYSLTSVAAPKCSLGPTIDWTFSGHLKLFCSATITATYANVGSMYAGIIGHFIIFLTSYAIAEPYLTSWFKQQSQRQQR